MINFTPPPKSRSTWILWAVIGSFMLHGVLFAAGDRYAEQKERTKYDTSRIAFTAAPVEPEPKPESEPEPEPEPEIELELEPVPEPESKPNPVKRAPKSNTQKKIPPQAEPPKPVFGATADSVGNGDSSVSIRVGNTLDKTMEKSAPPKKVAPLAQKTKVAEPLPPQKAAPPTIKPVPVYSLSKAPSFKSKIEPRYPEGARQAELEGVVQLEVLIDATGKVRNIKVLQTPGGGLEKAAISALTKSRFKPGMVGNKPVPVKIKIPYRFILDS